MRVDLFDFDLPEDRIALRPEKERSQARLLVVRPGGQPELEDRRIADLPALLRAGDVLVVNDTKVVPARLTGIRRRPGGEAARVEATLVERLGPSTWRVFAKPGKRLRPGDEILFGDAGGDAGLSPPHPEERRRRVSKDGPEGTGDTRSILRDAVPDGTAPQDEAGAWSKVRLTATVLGKDEAAVDLGFSLSGEDLDRAFEAVGDMPLPPYIAARRKPDDTDRADYQTMFARETGAVAAPTAGLHFTPALLDRLKAARIGVERVTLHVGAGTFLPVKAEDTAGHVMHSEWARLDPDTAVRLNAARARGGRVVAVGTTPLRVLESAAASGELGAFEGNTDIFITPGYRFRAVDALVTNFHLPRSTLVMLVAAFIGHDLQKRAYAHAIETGYRFYSYGDASLLFRAE